MGRDASGKEVASERGKSQAKEGKEKEGNVSEEIRDR